MDVLYRICERIHHQQGLRELRRLSLVCRAWHDTVLYFTRRHVYMSTDETDLAYIHAMLERFTAGTRPTLFPYGPEHVRSVRVLVWIRTNVEEDVLRNQLDTIVVLLALFPACWTLTMEFGNAEFQPVVGEFVARVWDALPCVKHLTLEGQCITAADIESTVVEYLGLLQLYSLDMMGLHSLQTTPLHKLFMGQTQVRILRLPLLLDDSSQECILDALVTAGLSHVCHLALDGDYNPLDHEGYQYVEDWLCASLAQFLDLNTALTYFALDFSHSFHVPPLCASKVLRVLARAPSLTTIVYVHPHLDMDTIPWDDLHHISLLLNG